MSWASTPVIANAVAPTDTVIHLVELNGTFMENEVSGIKKKVKEWIGSHSGFVWRIPGVETRAVAVFALNMECNTTAEDYSGFDVGFECGLVVGTTSLHLIDKESGLSEGSPGNTAVHDFALTTPLSLPSPAVPF